MQNACTLHAFVLSLTIEFSNIFEGYGAENIQKGTIPGISFVRNEVSNGDYYAKNGKCYDES